MYTSSSICPLSSGEGEILLSIDFIKDESGNWNSGRDSINGECFVRHFENLFSFADPHMISLMISMS